DKGLLRYGKKVSDEEGVAMFMLSLDILYDIRLLLITFNIPSIQRINGLREFYGPFVRWPPK
ncbi:hypothetical protein Dimus_034073, partial [Dionaea muscipula]